MHASVAEFETRVRRGPEVVRATLNTPLPEGLAPWSETSVVLTGIGASAAVARTAEQLLRHELRLRVSMQPLSEFLSSDVSAQGTTLVILSQELCPNARLALQRVDGFHQTLLLSSLAHDDERLGALAGRGTVWTLPPDTERGLLVRMMGPLATTLALLRLAWACSGKTPPAALARVPEAMEAALQAGFAVARDWADEHTRPPFLAMGWYASALASIRWTWMEALWVEEPANWDLLEVVHGPWQSRIDARGPWLAFTRPDEAPGLWERFESMLPATQRLVRVPATLPAPLCFFEHFAFIQALLCGLLARRDVDLNHWPGEGTDGPLYRFDGVH